MRMDKNLKFMKGIASFPKEKRVKATVAVGLIGMALILISSFFSTKPATENKNKEFDAEVYTVDLEKRLETILGHVEGIGKLEIMVTLESSNEQIYAVESKQTTDKSVDKATSGSTKEEERISSESAYILIDQGSGVKKGLVLMSNEPVIKGVVVVCQGGGNAKVKLQIVSAVATAMGISSNKVCVIKMG